MKVRTQIDSSNVAAIDDSRRRLLEAIGDDHDLTFVRGYGNVGDDLIHAGARQLLRGLKYREVSILRLEGVAGRTAVVSGSGGWCSPHHEMPDRVRQVEARFERVV